MNVYRLRFFFDYGSGICFWSANDAANERFDYPIESDKLPLTIATQEAIEHLIEQYDRSLNWSDPGGPGLWNRDEWRIFDASVRQLLPIIRQELGPDYEIVDEYNYIGDPD
jgi:hypothetical protein